MEYKGLFLIVAISDNNVIGLNGKIPWRETPEDRKRFKKDMERFRDLTTGHPVIMGRKTYQSLPLQTKNPNLPKTSRALPNRSNIVVTHDSNFNPTGVHVRHSIEDALNLAREIDNKAYYVIGGAEIYRQILPYASMIELTRIHQIIPGDTMFPDVNWDDWKRIYREKHEDEGFTFETYRRKIREQDG